MTGLLDVLVISPSGRRVIFSRPYVLGWIYVAFVLMAAVGLMLIFLIVVWGVSVSGIWKFIRGGAPGYWRAMVDEAGPEKDASKN